MLKLFNTLTRKKEEFKPLKKGQVGLYTCGPTVYLYAHIGNHRTNIFSDLLKRVLFYNKFKVKHVMNITDVGHLTSDRDTGEDKVEKQAKKEGKSAWEISKYYTEVFKDDLKKLNIINPNIWCKATDHIKEQIELIKVLEKKGFTYNTSDGIYFDTSKLNDYGKLARLKAEGLQAGKRINIGEKKNPTDFALWKFSPKNEKRQMEWKSPWGVGFPGWHLECSAMSMRYLGKCFDIHTGGTDHVPVHHTNEIAQSEAATEKKFVNYWMHGEFLILKEGRMGKSEGNIITISELEKKGYSALDYRYFCLSAHYRKPLEFSFEALDKARNVYQNLKIKTAELKADKTKGNKADEYIKSFDDAVNDDLNMPKTLAAMWDMIYDNKVASSEKYKALLRFDKIFGLGLDKVSFKIPKNINNIAKEREKSRKNKDWRKSDELRKEIDKKGYIIEDSEKGYIIKPKVL